MQKQIITGLFVLLFSFPASAQVIPPSPPAKFSMSGNVKDSKTGEALIGVNVLIKELPGIGTVTNAYGFYSITIPAGNYTIVAQYIGYEPKDIALPLTQNTTLNFELFETSLQLKEVTVSANKENKIINRSKMGVETMRMKDISKIPVIMGEKDILKTIQLLPGMKATNEGGTGFYVRGGGSDQNLILLDEALVHNASHLLGFFSVFNPDAIKDVTLYKGSIPAEYGGRLSSVLDIKMNDGNNKDYIVNGGIGLIASRLSVEGPIVKDKGSFIVSARRTYADLFLKFTKDLNSTKLYFYDLNAKSNYRINDNNRVFLSVYTGRDVVGFTNQFSLDYGNVTGTLRWNHILNNKLFSNTSFIYSNYNYQISREPGGNKIDNSSSIEDYNVKQDFQYYTSGWGTLKFGFNAIYHNVNPGTVSTRNGIAGSTLKPEKYAWENAIYASHDVNLNKRFILNFGFRLNAFSVAGPGDFYTFDSNGVKDTMHYASGSIIKTYVNFEPRLSVNYRINDNNSLKASYARTTQNLHLVSGSSLSNPTDTWIPTSLNVKPEIGEQYSLGYYRVFKEQYEFSVETYFKNLKNQIDFKDGAQLESNATVETELLFGKGRAYGVEFLLKKTKGNLTGWLGYTLSRTERKFAGINKGNYFPAKQDRTHDITLVASYELSPKWSLSANWVFNTGNAVTFPGGKYGIDGKIVNYYTERNGYRMPAYHRLDIGATWQRRKTEKHESSWSFSIYNLYARQNPFLIRFEKSENNPDKTEAIQTSLLSIVPSITYNFKF